MTYKFADKAEVACGPVIVTELTPPKETDISTETLLEIHRFASSIEPYLANCKGDMPDYLLDNCLSIIGRMESLIMARTKED